MALPTSPFDPFAAELKAALIDRTKVDPPFNAVFEGRWFPEDDRRQVALLESEPQIELESYNQGASQWQYNYIVRYRIRLGDEHLGDRQKDLSEQAAQAVLDRYRYATGLAFLGEDAFASSGFQLHWTESEALGLDDDTQLIYEAIGRVRVSFIGAA